jgi:hypothetical protein
MPTRYALPLVVLLGVACLAPFAGKAFHIDDPLFLWSAQHIQSHPLDFFGFNVNWYDTEQPMWDVTQNPPGACYYLAVVAALVGWGEVGLHLAFLLPAVGMLVGTYRLAEQHGVRQLPATLMTLFTPVMFVSSASVMSDVLMTCLWTWAVVIWTRGVRESCRGRLYAAAALVVLATLTKYFGLCLIPLLAAYSMTARLSLRRWVPPLGLATLALAGYQVLTWQMYGHGLLFNAMGYAVSVGDEPRVSRVIVAMAFTGGCLGGVLFFLPWLVRGTTATLGYIAIAVVMYLVLADRPLAFGDSLAHDSNGNWVIAQILLWAGVGGVILHVAGQRLTGFKDLWRDPDAMLLVLWVFGTFVFTALVNWTVNGRSVLPLVPAAAVLIVRRLDAGGARWRYLSLVPSAALAFLVGWADYHQAGSAKLAAERLAERYVHPPEPCYSEGHWGFQYYAQLQGTVQWDVNSSYGRPGRYIIIPANNTNLIPFEFGAITPVEILFQPAWPWLAPVPVGNPRRVVPPRPCFWLATMRESAGAGFYASIWGPLPFAFGPINADDTFVFEFTRSVGVPPPH